MNPAPFLRGNAFPAVEGVPYPRAPADDRLPADTWNRARLPVGVRLEFLGDCEAVEIAYRTEPGAGARPGDGRSFSLWRGDLLVDERPAEVGDGTVRLETGGGPPDLPAVVYLPEAMRPTILALEPVGGEARPAPRGPSWTCYGDSIAEGWVASAPARAWPAIVARRLGLDVVNMGYAGAARGEIASAEHVASLPAAIISIAFGTNCWTRVPFTPGMLREGLAAFHRVVRAAHPDAPVLVVSPILRPDAEDTPNPLGATLAGLRSAMEDTVEALVGGGDARLCSLGGLGLVGAGQLADGVHPDDAGHEAMADGISRELRTLLEAG